ncbi:hypothetical protein HDU78_002139 [Chytriomyces hyalinus]|nr:hypothetical protein HDU78_002139 [Chytriomyces hyalinus]
MDNQATSLWGDGYDGKPECNGDEEDLEDLAVSFEAATAIQDGDDDRIGGAVTLSHSKREETPVQNANVNANADSIQTESDLFLPGQAKVWVKTWGCGHNVSDGEYMAGLLSSHGYSVVFEDAKKEDADLWLLNSCTVKGPSELSFINDIKRGQGAGKKVVVAGCVPQASGTVGGSIGRGKGKGREWDNLSVVGVQQIDRVVEVVEETLKGNVIRLTREKKVEVEKEGTESGADGDYVVVKKRKAGGAKLDLPKVRRNPYVEIIPINTGCLNQCTYCKTKHARGDLGSYSPQEIWERVEAVIQEGVKEIWLTSEDTGAYGRDIGVSIVELLWGIVAILERYHDSGTMLRVGMTNPPYILEHLDEMVKILSHPRVFSFLHVPVQSGSNNVLDAMRRQYTVADFSQIVTTLRDRVTPNGCTVATDIICGFPTETDEDFQETMALLREHTFTVLHISQFYSRPGTPAALLPRLPSELVKARSRIVSQLFNEHQPNEGLEGLVTKALVTELSSDGKFYVGHDKLYRQILVPKDERLLGRWVEVEIVRTGKFFLEGKLLSIIGGDEPDAGSTSEKSGLDLEDAGVASEEKVVKLGKGAVVKRRRAPKLVNVGGKMVNLDANEASKLEGDDGTVLSVPDTFQIPKTADVAENDNAKANSKRDGSENSDWSITPGVIVSAGVAALTYGGLRLMKVRHLGFGAKMIGPGLVLAGGLGLTVSGLLEAFKK